MPVQTLSNAPPTKLIGLRIGDDEEDDADKVLWRDMHRFNLEWLMEQPRDQSSFMYWEYPEEVERQLVSADISFYRQLGNKPDDIVGFTIAGIKKGRAKCRVKIVPEEAEDLDNWCKRLRARGTAIEYRGDGLGGLMMRFMTTSLRDTRTACTDATRDELLQKQRGHCAYCGDPLKRRRHNAELAGYLTKDHPKELLPCEGEVDHRVSLSSGGTNSAENLQVLCFECHRNKTREEQQRGLDNISLLESALSPQLWQIFVEEPKHRQNCWGTPDLDENSYRPCIDAIAARRSALFECPLPLPVFCVADEVEPYCPLRGLQYYSYIEIDLTRDGIEGAEQDQQYAPYRGRHFYWVELAYAMLMDDLCTVASFVRGVRASGSVRSERLKEIMDEAEICWTEMCGSCEAFPHRAGPVRRKAMEVALIGTMNSCKRLSWRETRSVCTGDALSSGRELRRWDEGQGCHVIHSCQELVSNRSCRPLGEIALQIEQLHVARILRAVWATGSMRVLAVVGDGVVVDDWKGAKEICERLMFRGKPACKLKKENTARLPRCPWRYEDRALQKPVEIATWACEMTEQPGEDRDEFVDAVMDQAVERGGMAAVGVAGVGKTVLLRKLRDRLIEIHGRSRVFTSAFMIATAARVGGKSLLHVLHNVGRKRDCHLIIDEGSQISMELWADILALKLVGWKIYVLGDWRGQLPPVMDRWSGTVTNMEESALLKQLSNGFKVTLTHNMR